MKWTFVLNDQDWKVQLNENNLIVSLRVQKLWITPDSNLYLINSKLNIVGKRPPWLSFSLEKKISNLIENSNEPSFKATT